MTEATSQFATVPIEISVAIGRVRSTIGDLLALQDNAVLVLDKSIDDPVELFIGDRLIALGVLEETTEDGDGALCVRLTKVLGIGPESL